MDLDVPPQKDDQPSIRMKDRQKKEGRDEVKNHPLRLVNCHFQKVSQEMTLLVRLKPKAQNIPPVLPGRILSTSST